MQTTQTLSTPVVETITLTLTAAEAKDFAELLVQSSVYNRGYSSEKEDALNKFRWDAYDSINAALSVPTNSVLFDRTEWHANAAEKIRDGKRILAIKEVRAGTGWGLKAAKDYVDFQWPPNR